MEIKIGTKFSPNDVAIGYYNGNFYRFRVDDIEIESRTLYNRTRIRYHCTALMPEGSELTFCHDFEEHELMTKEEFKEKTGKFINEYYDK